MKQYFLLFLLWFPVVHPAKGENLHIEFRFLLHGETVMPGKYYTTDSIQVTTFKFYISDIRYMDGNKEAFAPKEKFFLIDLGDINSHQIDFETEKEFTFDKIEFNIGIDSITSVSGAFGGALDPTSGMYWTWQSGYINFKLEGSSPQCRSRNNHFQFHIGGYSYPNNALRAVTIPAIDSKCTVNVDIGLLLDKVNIAQTTEIMSPGKPAMQFADLFNSIFTGGQ